MFTPKHPEHMKAITRKQPLLTPQQRQKALEEFVDKIAAGVIVPFAQKTEEARQNLIGAGLLTK